MAQEIRLSANAATVAVETLQRTVRIHLPLAIATAVTVLGLLVFFELVAALPA